MTESGTQCLFLTISDVSGYSSVKFTAIATTVIGIISSIGSILGNGLVLFVLLKHERLRTPSNVLLGSLCLTDFLTGFIVVPTISVRRITEAYGSGICIIRIVCAYFSYLTVIVSVVTIGLISIDRYYAIMMPFRYQRNVTARKYMAVLTLVWLILAVHSSLPFLKILSGTTFFNIAFSLMGVTIIMFAALYTRISKVAKRHQSKIYPRPSSYRASELQPQDGTADTSGEESSNHRISERKRTNTIAIILATAVICYGPLALIFVLRGIQGDTFELVYIADPWADLILYLNSSINPVIYCFRARDINEAVLGALPNKARRLFNRTISIRHP